MKGFVESSFLRNLSRYRTAARLPFHHLWYAAIMGIVLSSIVFAAEETLRKLKLGSQRQLSLPSEQTAQIEINCCVSSSCAGIIPSASKSSQDTGFSPHEEMAMDADCSADRSSPGTAHSHCMTSTRHQRNRNISVLYLFSKYSKSREVVDLSCEDVTPTEDGCSASVSTSSTDCQSLGSVVLQMGQECTSALPFSPM